MAHHHWPEAGSLPLGPSPPRCLHRLTLNIFDTAHRHRIGCFLARLSGCAAVVNKFKKIKPLWLKVRDHCGCVDGFRGLSRLPLGLRTGLTRLSVGGVAGPTWTRTRSVSPVDILVLMSAEVSRTQSNVAHSVTRSFANYQTLVSDCAYKSFMISFHFTIRPL